MCGAIGFSFPEEAGSGGLTVVKEGERGGEGREKKKRGGGVGVGGETMAQPFLNIKLK